MICCIFFFSTHRASCRREAEPQQSRGKKNQKHQKKKKSQTGGKFVHSPSFEDFSLGTEADVQETLSPKAAEQAKKDLGRSSAPGDLTHEAPPPSTPSPTAAKAVPQQQQQPGSSMKMSSSSPTVDEYSPSPSAKQPSGATLWGNVFHFRHRQSDTGAPVVPVGGYYDSVTPGEKTTWEEVLKAERLKTLAELPRTRVGAGGGAGGGEEELLDAEQLRAALGASDDVEQLIAAARDGRDDARVPFNTFASLLRNS